MPITDPLVGVGVTQMLFWRQGRAYFIAHCVRRLMLSTARPRHGCWRDSSTPVLHLDWVCFRTISGPGLAV